MHQSNPTARNMRVRIADNGAAVRRPARVGDPHRAVQLFGFNLLHQLLYALHGTRTADRSVFNHGHTTAVVTAVFQTPQSLKQNGHDFFLAHADQNSAHIVICLLKQTK